MLRLLAFLTQNRNLLLFLVLEGVALSLVVSYNDQQRHIFGDGMLELTSEVQLRRNRVSRYFHLDDYADQMQMQVDSLQDTLIDLKKRLALLEALIAMDSSGVASTDSLLSQEAFSFLPCRAIRSTTSRNYNYITLDKGARHGVEVNMGLLSPQGVAGKVIRVSENFSLALSALNVSFKLQAKVEKLDGRDNVGLYEWSGSDPEYGYLNNLPLDIPLKEGDRVVTSGYSTIFPEGFPVGTVAEVTRNTQAGYFEAKVKLATNFRALGNLYLVKALHKPELESLEENLSQ